MIGWFVFMVLVGFPFMIILTILIMYKLGFREKDNVLRKESYKCHRCGQLITAIEMESLKYDVGCPKCGGSLVNFS